MKGTVITVRVNNYPVVSKINDDGTLGDPIGKIVNGTYNFYRIRDSFGRNWITVALVGDGFRTWQIDDATMELYLQPADYDTYNHARYWDELDINRNVPKWWRWLLNFIDLGDNTLFGKLKANVETFTWLFFVIVILFVILGIIFRIKNRRKRK